MAKKSPHNFTKTNVDRVFVKEAFFPVPIAGHRRVYKNGAKQKANNTQDIYIVDGVHQDFMHSRTKLVSELVNEFTGQNCDVVFATA